MFKWKKKEIVSLQIDKQKCNGCESCVFRCRRKVLDMVYTNDRAYATVKYPNDCTGCRKCVSVCCSGAIELITK
jgi:NAD-dependent dihydropyrimidine dehydrogenase PreA subunit